MTEITVNYNDVTCFKVHNYNYLTQSASSVIVESVSVLCGSYDIKRKYAALLLLKALVKHDFLKCLMGDTEKIYPFSRNDSRVVHWSKKILRRGACEVCGDTKDLEAHHIVKWADYPQGRADINNGQCLCHECHTNIHIGDQSYYMMKAKK